MINQTYRLISTKRTETVPGTLPEAIARAIAIETEYQPAFGVTVETILGRDTVAEIRDGVSDCEIPAAAQRLLDSIDTGWDEGGDTQDVADATDAGGALLVWMRGSYKDQDAARARARDVLLACGATDADTDAG